MFITYFQFIVVVAIVVFSGEGEGGGSCEKIETVLEK